jgi:branched-chain amino acid transport system permease protein
MTIQTAPKMAPIGVSSQRIALDRGPFIAVLVLLALGGLGYFAFADDLAFLTRAIAIAIFVLSLDLVVGYCGVATLGHAALFGAGAYAAGIAAVHGLTDPFLLLVLGALAGAFNGLWSGALIVRFAALPQLVLSIAIVQLLSALANKVSSITGGSDGLAGIEPSPILGLFAFDLFSRTAYLFGLGLVIIIFIVLAVIVRSPFGLLCRGIREDPVRVRAIGARVHPALLKMYVISGAVAGIAGAFAAITTGVVGLDSVSFERSAEALVMLVLGGTGSLYGALIGAFVFQAFEHVVSAANPFHWLTLVGLLLIVVVLFLPRGLQDIGRIALRFRARGNRA